MHAKTFIADRKTAFTGSPNLTHHGYGANKKHLVRISGCGAVDAMIEDFEQHWEKSFKVDEEIMEKLATLTQAKIACELKVREMRA